MIRYLVNEECDFYVLIDSVWTFYEEGRISTLFTKTNKGWKIIQEHGSMPDARTVGGEQVNTDKIKAENVRLKDAVKRRTIELEEKNHELEIETALEKVRAVAMGMHKPNDLLNVCEVMYKEFLSLGFSEIRNAIININNDTGGSFINYDYAEAAGKNFGHFKNNVLPFVDKIIKIGKSKEDAFSETYISGKALAEFKRLRKKTGQKNDPKLNKAKSLYFYFYSIGIGTIGISTFGPISKEKKTLLKRFRNVFNLSYQRYVDISNAKAQAREAQIEAALEKVRARGMAMQTSEELGVLIGTLFTELTKLDLVLTRCVTWIIDPKTNDAVWWMANSEDPSHPMSYFIAYHEQPPWLAFMKEWKKRTLKWVYDLKGQTKKNWDDHLFSKTGLAKMPKFIKDGMRAPVRVLLSASFNNFGGINVASLEPLSVEHFNILLRFAKVFDQTYTRFLDLQNAEKQTREAEIELALERVRAKTMAMQKSDELPQTTFLLFQQLKKLGETAAQISIGIVNEEKGFVELSATVHGNQMLQTYHILADEPFMMKKAVKAWKEKKGSLIIKIEGKRLKEYNSWRNSVLKKKIVFPEKQWIVNLVFFSKGMLSFSSDMEISKETFQLLERFANVFDGTYTRFLDLQKAEAQTREAEIELALERVRAKTMAMQKSDELKETTLVLFQQFKALGTTAAQVSICIFDEEVKMGEMFVTLKGEKIDRSFPMEIGKESFVMKKAKNAFLNKQKKFSITIKGKELQNYNRWRNSLVGKKGWDESDAVRKQAWYVDAVFFSGGMMGISSETPASDEAIKLLDRFANVFDLAYTRFNDLKKAEAQAKESQIQLALERVRARTMAMQKSEELPEAANLLFQQLQSLGMPAWNAGYCIWDEDKKTITLWMSSEGVLQPPFRAPLTEDPSFIHFLEAHERGETFFVDEIGGEELVRHYKYMRTLPVVGEILDSIIEAGHPLPTFQIFHLAYFSQGFLLFITYESVPEAHDIFKRFAKVFEQTYTRFLDLQKAEAQARESQIQLALERVRARTMAMQRSNELMDAASLLFKQIEDLGTRSWSSGFIIFQPEDLTINSWMSKPDGSMGLPFNIPLTEDPFFIKIYEAYKRGEEFFVLESGGKELAETYRYMFSLPGAAKALGAIEDIGFQMPTFQITHCAFFPQGFLMFITYEQCPEMWDIFKRFGKVFEQTYTRFLDLQKAEAQARESQIQLSLERVRASAMAMHHSDELSDVLSILFEQFDVLSIRPVDTHLDLFDLEKNTFSYRATGKEGKRVIAEQIVDLDSRPEWQSLADRWKKCKPNTVEFSYYPKEVINDLMAFFPDIWASMPPEAIMVPEVDFPDGIYDTLGYCKFGFLGFHHNRKTTEEENRILIRFANEFERLYQRFLDLQKAEAQAREAQIEASLERVRSKTMAMHSSDDVGDTVATMFNEFVRLGIQTNRCGILIFSDEPAGEVWTAKSNPEGKANLIIGKLDLTVHALLYGIHKAWKKKETFYTYTMEGDDLRNYYQALNELEYYPVKFDMNTLPSKEFHSDFYFPEGSVFTFTTEPLPDEASRVIKKFAAVFGQTYRRYLDLQRAEAQAREAKIEAALEKVRSRTMAMQRSDELSETAAVLFQEFKKLGEEDLLQLTIGIYNEAEGIIEFRVTSWAGGGAQVDRAFNLSIEEPTLLKPIFTAWKEGKKSVVVDLTGQQLEDWLKYRNANTGVTVLSKDTSGRRVVTVAFFSKGHISISSPELKSSETIQLLERFAAVFDLTYTRFLDLKNAEAQARESQIQLALERVRARTMAMQHSDELKEAAALLFQQAKALGVPAYSCGYNIWEKDDKVFTSWMSTQDGSIINGVPNIPLTEDANFKRYVESREKGEPFFVLELRDGRMQEHYQYLKTIPAFKAYFDYAVSVGFDLPKTQIHYLANFSHGNLLFISLEPCPEFHDVFKRFAAVFEQTYTRFLDLQKAEAQAREAQIEAALERVRSKTMAMHSSQDIAETVDILFQELTKLHVDTLRCGVSIIHDTREMEVWTANPDAEGKASLTIGKLPMSIYPSLEGLFDAWKNKESHFVYDLSGQDLVDYFTAINNAPDYPIRYDLSKLPPRQVINCFLFNEGALFAFTTDLLTPEAIAIFKRFATLFGQTYRRYLDLQKAEALAREATIEAALEKVRGKAMAMHNSNDLSVTASMVFTELKRLGINPIRCGVGLIDKDSHKARLYSATSSADGESLSLVGWVQLTGHPVLDKIYDSLVNIEEYYPVLEGGKQLRAYYKLLLAGLSVPVPDFTDDQKQYGHFIPFPVGCLYAWADTPYNETEIKILRRFATIIDLTFRRYLELQKSEANAREAVKQAALDRIRADIASMRTIGDLNRIIPLIWNELTILGLPFIRCGVFIMDNEQQLIHTFLSTPEGKAIAAFHIPYDTPGKIRLIPENWKKKTLYLDHWGDSDFIDFANTLVQQHVIDSSEQYLSSIPHGGFYLHFVPFLQGMLYVGNSAKLDGTEISLIESVADAFSTAYARYEDFNKLEAAKRQVDKTLVDLKQAQQQLVQSEKMASLGELTAGIAHEIQNPLNFVNNFSDVSTELLEEMKTELEKGNTEDAKTIADDVIQNLEKILVHGKRADGIVKSMLQHSRASSGKKEATNINALADEYLRLAYHGLRAKDKLFNATMKTDYDETIGNINIISQDIGRVILNLITNAFYVVTEKKNASTSSTGQPYEPTVTVTTKKIDNIVEVSVRDNGNGIPQKVLDKIFQPFFTTKPTGQGTGLGLSLSYDIVKAHGGEIKVETKEGEGSEFIIILPLS